MWHMVNIIILVCMVIVPMVVLASVPTTTSFDRHNTYEMDGFRDGGYYAVRQNSLQEGYMNMSHVGGTNEFNISTYNIDNITLDMDLMFERRKFLFGWQEVGWQEMVASLGNEIVINIDSYDGINELRFTDNPNVKVQILRDGEIYQDWAVLESTEIEITPLESGTTQVIIKFDQFYSTYELLYSLLILIIILAIILLIARYIHRALFYDGSYYQKWGQFDE